VTGFSYVGILPPPPQEFHHGRKALDVRILLTLPLGNILAVISDHLCICFTLRQHNSASQALIKISPRQTDRQTDRPEVRGV